MKLAVFVHPNVSALVGSVNEFVADKCVERTNEIYVPGNGMAILVWYTENAVED